MSLSAPDPIETDFLPMTSRQGSLASEDQPQQDYGATDSSEKHVKGNPFAKVKFIYFKDKN